MQMWSNPFCSVSCWKANHTQWLVVHYAPDYALARSGRPGYAGIPMSRKCLSNLRVMDI